MSTTEPAAKKSRYLLTDWNPNDESTWDSKLAWRTLWITTYSLILAFCVWFLPSAIAPKLTLLGFNLDKSQLYWLTALPGLAAGILRLIYMFLPPLIGTRKLVGITSLLCILPMAGWFYVVQDNTTPYWVLLTLAFIVASAAVRSPATCPPPATSSPSACPARPSVCRAASATSACLSSSWSAPSSWASASSA